MTQLIRVKMETYEALQKLAGKLQSKSGKRISLDAAIQFLLLEKPTKNAKKEAENALQTDPKEPLKWFSLNHQGFKDEKSAHSEAKEGPKTAEKAQKPVKKEPK